MAYIFLDESGDLGFGKKSSKWFLITIAIARDKRALERVIKKTWKSLRKKHKHIGELHASNEKPLTRLRMAHLLSECSDLKVMVVVLNKEKVYIDLQNQKDYLYLHTANLLLDKLHQDNIIPDKEFIELVADRKDTKKSLQENFVNHISKSMKRNRKSDFRISLHTSHDNKSLQAVDFISWSIFRKYEHGDYEYYEKIKNKIIKEEVIFP